MTLYSAPALPSGLPIKQAKTDAKRLSKSEGIPLHAALDRIANQQGFRTWAALMTASVHDNNVVDNKHIAVIGRSGSGKTTLINKFATKIVSGGGDLAVIDLADTSQLTAGLPAGSFRIEPCPKSYSEVDMLADRLQRDAPTAVLLDEIWVAGHLGVALVDVASRLNIPCVLSGSQSDGFMLKRIVGDWPMRGYCIMQSKSTEKGSYKFFTTLEEADADRGKSLLDYCPMDTRVGAIHL